MSDLKHFEEQGYVFCQGFIDAQAVSDIHDNLARVIANVVPSMPTTHVFYEDGSDSKSLKQLQKLHEQDSFFGTLMRDSPFRKLAEDLLGEEVTCENMQYFNKPPGISKPTPAHQDGYYFKLDPPNALTMWLALEEVDAENGCVRYVPRSHTMGMRPHGKTGTLGFSQGITDFPTEHDSDNEIGFPAKPGDLLAHHSLTIHRAEANRSSTRSRKALGFIYYGVSAKVDENARERYRNEVEKDLAKQDRT
ncbi:MAG: phytanoyl-CoA dioxygenase family protein [Mariniblastus sp.]